MPIRSKQELLQLQGHALPLAISWDENQKRSGEGGGSYVDTKR